MTIVWNEDLETGISILDEQHHAIFELINGLDGYKKSKEDFYNLILEIQKYVYSHFSTEEEYMRYMNYPEYNNHKLSHDKFISDYQNIVKRFYTAPDVMEVANELINFIENWLKGHYSNEDLKWTKYVNKNR